MTSSAATAPRTWLITGASSGIGNALTRKLLGRGERVIATARDRSSIAGLEDQHPDIASAVELDVTDSEGVRRAVDAAVGRLGRIDVVVSNAGYGLFGALEELDDADLRRQLETNFFGVVNLVRAVLPHLRRERAGHIVHISSLEGIAPLLAGETIYAASKFAAEGMLEGLAKELAPLGLAVTIVEPGPVRTEFANHAEVHEPSMSDYGDSVGAALAAFEQLAGNQPNDPALVADAIIRMVEADEPPLRLVLGTEAVESVRAKLHDQLHELHRWEGVAGSVAYAGR